MRVVLSLACCICAVHATERTNYIGGSPNSVDDAKKQILTALYDLKQLIQTRAPRSEGVCASGGLFAPQPVVDGALIEQIKCILCQLQTCACCDIDNSATWTSLIDEIACSHIDAPDVPQDWCAVAAIVAQALTEILARIGCPDCDNPLLPPDVLGSLCYLSSQVDVIESQIDVIESNIASCCTVIGSPDETVDCDFALTETNCSIINETDLSIIQWLKAIFIKCK